MHILLPLALEVLAAMSSWLSPRDMDVERYQSIAFDIASVAEEAPVFEGPDAARKTAIMMASIASLESFYRGDVDDFRVKGDSGKALGLMQVQLRGGERCADRVECLRIGRERIRESMVSCARVRDPLALYISGPKCLSTWGSRERWRRAAVWLGLTVPVPTLS